jgi:hypothetical protein
VHKATSAQASLVAIGRIPSHQCASAGKVSHDRFMYVLCPFGLEARTLPAMLTCVPYALQFYGQQTGETVFFGDKSAKKFGTYWVDNDTGAVRHVVSAPCSVLCFFWRCQAANPFLDLCSHCYSITASIACIVSS